METLVSFPDQAGFQRHHPRLGAGKMYWIDNEAHKIQRANLDGTQIEDLVTAPAPFYYAMNCPGYRRRQDVLDGLVDQ